MKARSSIVDIRAVLASLVTAGAPPSTLCVLTTSPWADLTIPTIDHRAPLSLSRSPSTPSGATHPIRSNAIHEAFTGDRPGAVETGEAARTTTSSVPNKTAVFDRASAVIQSAFALSNLQPARAVEADAQCVCAAASTFTRSISSVSGRTTPWWRNDSVPILEADDRFNAQVTALTNPLAAHDMAHDAGNRSLVLARVVMRPS